VTTAKFAKLEQADIRTAWPHEARNFTPWLLDNLDGLSDAIGIPLEAEASEVAVESFSADIIARNPFDNSRVLIENQLESSDHTHLGQILTYLAGLEAQTIIWVASDFREPHLSAFKWLNESTTEPFAFFAVRVKVVRIGDSPFAPLFEVVVRPNNWERQLHAANPKSGGQSELGRHRLAFWTAYVSRVEGELARNGEAKGTSNRWRVIPELDLIVSMYVAVGQIGLFVRGPHRSLGAELTRDFLALHADAITERLGVPMGDGQYFFGTSRGGDYNDAQERDQLIDWLHEKAELYERTMMDVLGGTA